MVITVHRRFVDMLWTRKGTPRGHQTAKGGREHRCKWKGRDKVKRSGNERARGTCGERKHTAHGYGGGCEQWEHPPIKPDDNSAHNKPIM